jgi:hypothetical protein
MMKKILGQHMLTWLAHTQDNPVEKKSEKKTQSSRANNLMPMNKIKKKINFIKKKKLKKESTHVN